MNISCNNTAKRLLTSFSIGVFLIVSSGGASIAEDSKTLSTWIKTISVKLKLVSSGKDKKSGVAGVKVITPSDAMKRKEPSVTAGTKGEEASSKDNSLYYKDIKVSSEEVSLMEDALRLAEMGDKKGAVSKLEDFLKKYPKSALTKDAKEGIAALNSNGK